MKITEIERLAGLLTLIPTHGLRQATRVKVLLAQAAFEKAVTAYKTDAAAVLAKLKPDGFDELLRKFELTQRAADTLSDEQAAKVAELRADPDFAKFEEAYAQVASDYDEAQKEIRTSTDYDCRRVAFSDADWEDIASAMPADQTTEGTIVSTAGTSEKTMIANDVLLRVLMLNFA